MSNVILGSGIVGLLAKKILGPTWKLIPYSKSRFFNFNPALDDNYIIRDSKLDDFMGTLGATPRHINKTMFSCSGHLVQPNDELLTDWLNKLHETYDGHVLPVLKQRSVHTTYDIKINTLYESLINEYKSDILGAAAIGSPKSIQDHKLIFENSVIEYDKIISTIPIYALYNLLDYKSSCVAKPCYLYNIITKELDFEGANQILTTDFAFYKCNELSTNNYLFFCDENLSMPGVYFMQFLKKFDIINGTVIPDAIITGNRPAYQTLLSNLNITCVGSYAEWDPAMDVGTCILRLLTHSASD